MPAQVMELPVGDVGSCTPAAPTADCNLPLEGCTPRIRFEGVNVRYGKCAALVDFDLTLNAGEALALLGPSGSGKTTILRALAGFTPIDSGRITIDGTDISTLSPQQRGFGIVVQNYALFPHMNVADNVAFGLRARGRRRSEIRSTVAEHLELVGMSDYARSRPHELSGGQQQRVALARALAIRPDVLLMDEPLSALDAPLRREMLGELIRLHDKLPDLTMLFVTHDQAEALALADRVGLLRDGMLLALDTPKRLYNRPPNRFAAEFLGQTNLLRVDVAAGGNREGTIGVRLGSQMVTVRAHDGWNGRQNAGWLCLRPHQLTLRPDPQSAAQANRLHGVVVSSEWKGSHYRIHVKVEGQSIFLETNAMHAPPRKGSHTALFFSLTDPCLLPREERCPN